MNGSRSFLFPEKSFGMLTFIAQLSLVDGFAISSSDESVSDGMGSYTGMGIGGSTVSGSGRISKSRSIEVAMVICC